ncbi:hypothetical protein [Streptomyces albidoflavus]|uniref:hypothetical protein n=1 Tax=Streptomyces albidoflavus TaxID=1886 RepID=UPI0033DACEBF
MRTGENVAVVLTSYPDEAAQAEHLAALRDHPLAREEILPALARERIAPDLTLRLAPTARSLLR